MKLFTVLNPNAGNGSARKRFVKLRRDLQNLFELEVVETSGPEHAIAIARDARKRGCEHFLSVGGDGTTFEVVNGIQQCEASDPHGHTGHATIGVLPLGTGNSFMRDLHVNSVGDAMLALRTFAETGNAFPCDVLRLTHRDGVLYSFNQLGLGFVADAGDITNKKYKRLGVLGYVAAVFERTVHLDARRYRYSIEGETQERTATLIAICNSRCTGGTMKMAPFARIDDGKFDVIRIDELSRTRLLSCFPRIFAGTHIELPEVHSARAANMTFSLEGTLPTIIDGEVFHIQLEKIETLANAISFVGRAYP